MLLQPSRALTPDEAETVRQVAQMCNLEFRAAEWIATGSDHRTVKAAFESAHAKGKANNERYVWAIVRDMTANPPEPNGHQRSPPPKVGKQTRNIQAVLNARAREEQGCETD